MSRNLHSSTATAVVGETVMRTAAVFLDLHAAPFRVCGAPFNITISGDTYLGVGTLGSISGVEESSDTQATTITLALSGIPRDLVSTAMSEVEQNRTAEVWEVVVDPLTMAVIGLPIVVFKGRIDAIAIGLDAATAKVEVTVTNRLVNWERPSHSVYSDEEQQRKHTGDLGFKYAAAMETRQVLFPAAAWFRAFPG